MSIKLIRAALVIIGVYLLLDSVIHLFILRLKDVAEIWPTSALAFSKFLSQIYGSFMLLVALIILEISSKVEQYKNLIFIIGLWALLHGTILFYLLVRGFFDNFENYPSLSFYTGTFYEVIVFIESLFLVIFAVIAFYIKINYYKKT